MTVQQITQGMLWHELTLLTLGAVSTLYVKIGLEYTNKNNGFMQCMCNGYWIFELIDRIRVM